MTATDRIQRFPEEGEIITTTVRQVTGHGVYVTLDEYNTMTGFLSPHLRDCNWLD